MKRAVQRLMSGHLCGHSQHRRTLKEYCMLKSMDVDEKLIRLVKQHQCLYNIQAEEYADKKSKYRAWVQISKEMNLSVGECTKKWKQLRDCYRKAVKVRQQMVSSGRPCKRPIKFEKSLKFLVPYLEDRKTQTKPKKSDDSNLDLSEKISRLYQHFTDTSTDSFFVTISRKVRAMPKKIQAEVERDVFRIVNEAEMRIAYGTCVTSAVDLQCIMPSVEDQPSSSYVSHEYCVPEQIKEEAYDE